MAYKRELIVNNGSLTSYKKLLKVSDVCQLLDKNTFYTISAEGTAATYNNDGTFTVSGTATANSWKNFPIFQLLPNGGKHVYLFNVNADSGTSDVFCNIYFYNEITAYAQELIAAGGNSKPAAGIITLNSTTIYQARFNITTLTGATPNNIIYKPQLFDLTEMFGAGNEPKTVAEFKAKFPNELYDYSPRCWGKAYKTGLITQTKNLFNINALTPYTPETLPTKTAGRYNGNIITKCDSGTSVSRSNKLLKELCPNLVAGERYILHFDTNGTGSQANTIYLNGTETVWVNGYAHVVTEAELNETVFFYGNYPSLDVATISNFQIEKGTTATDYVPYGYL